MLRLRPAFFATSLWDQVEGGAEIEAVIVCISSKAVRNNVRMYRAANKEETRQKNITEVERRCPLAASHETQGKSSILCDDNDLAILAVAEI